MTASASSREPGAQWDIDVVVAVHDLRRQLQRCVASLVGSCEARVRVTVVAHGLNPSSVADALGLLADHVRIVAFDDGVRSPAGPFNYGLKIATARYVAIIGSDDRLDDGALDQWFTHCEAHATDYLIAPLRNQDGASWRDPLVRPRRTHRLHPVRDRLNYRAAPLGLVRRDYLNRVGVALSPGLSTGEDIELGLALLNGDGRIDVGPAMAAYVIGLDAPERVTLEPRPIGAELAALDRLRSCEWLGRLDSARRRAVAVKLWRMNIVPAVLLRDEPVAWAEADLATLHRVARWLTELSPRAALSLSRAERAIVDVAGTGDVEAIIAASARVRAATSADRLLTSPLWHLFDRDAMARRAVRLRWP